MQHHVNHTLAIVTHILLLTAAVARSAARDGVNRSLSPLASPTRAGAARNHPSVIRSAHRQVAMEVDSKAEVTSDSGHAGPGINSYGFADSPVVRLLVIGEVSSSSARILIELEPTIAELPSPPFALFDGSRRIYPTPFDAQGTEASRARLASGLPVVFVFNNLVAGTLHNVDLFGMQTPKISSSMFRTFPAGLDAAGQVAHGANIGFVSCNKYSLTHNEIPPSQDLWKALAHDVSTLDMVVHLGDNVYLDDDRTVWLKGETTGAKSTPADVLNWCMYCRAHTMLEGYNTQAEWERFRADIVEIFRSMYRATWGHPPTAQVLANVPNLFAMDDHEVRDSWSDQPEDWDVRSKERWLGEIAFSVAAEYEYGLMGEGSANAARGSALSHFVTGNLGVLIVDVRFSKIFQGYGGAPRGQQYLGSQQWQSLHALFGPGGEMTKVDSLIVASPVPFVLMGSTANKVVGMHSLDAVGMWDRFPDEQNAFAKLLNKWKEGDAVRELTVVSGDVHFGGLTSLYIDDKHVFNQLTTSAISNRPHSQLAMAVAKFVGKVGAKLFNAKDLAWRHKALARERNYGKIKIEPGSGSQRALMVQELYISDNLGGSKLHSRMTSDNVEDLEEGIPKRYVFFWAVLLLAIVLYFKPEWRKQIGFGSSADPPKPTPVA